MPFAREASPSAFAAIAGASPVPFWLDSPNRPAALPALTGHQTTDLLVIGGGFTGLWTAILAKQEDAARDVVVIEAGRIGWAASGRNGGFCAASITHGLGNGLERWPEEMPLLLRLGQANLDGIAKTIDSYDIDCGFERTGELEVTTEPHQAAHLPDYVEAGQKAGLDLELLDASALRKLVDSPMYVGGVHDRAGVAMVDPGRLAWGLRRVALQLGVRVYEGTRGLDLANAGAGLKVATTSSPATGTADGSVTAGKVVLATNAFPPLLARLKHYVVSVYDYVVMTEPLSASQWESIGWAGRQGIGDAGNQFHYYRRTDDGRILFGGYDAIYRRRVSPSHDQRAESFALLATHLGQTFPELDGIGFSNTWGGAIDTCSRFSAFFGTARDGRLAYAAGYTGLGVGASRFGAAVMLDLLAGRRNERTTNRMVSTMPTPFPPEPFRSAGIGITQWSMSRADQHEGRRNLWLRTLDRLGLGFDS